MNEKKTKQDLILEMARINKNENSLFPYNGWDIIIWSNGHNPPHFHIIRDGWNVSFVIENGAVLNIESTGKDRSIYYYMTANVTKWLKSHCCMMPKLTNQENAMLQWVQIHDD